VAGLLRLPARPEPVCRAAPGALQHTAAHDVKSRDGKPWSSSSIHARFVASVECPHISVKCDS